MAKIWYNITVEEECIADITKLISSRRGKLKKVDVSNGKVVFIAFIPLVEILKNSSELSLEYQGQTLVFNEFSHYSEVSTSISEQVISGSNLLDGNILDISSIKDEQEEIIIKEIDRCTEGINNYLNGKFSLNIESLQDCLAYAFIKLSFIRNPNENILKALQAYGKASNICLRGNFEKYPIAQENIGNSYKHLSKIIDSEKNLSKAIEAYNEAISASEIFAKDKFKNKQIQSELINIYVEFGKNYNAQLGLGHAYMELGNITKNEENYLKAIYAFNIIVSDDNNLGNFRPTIVRYIDAKNSIGNSYKYLAEITDTENNLQKSIQIFNEVLKIITLEEYPLEFSTTYSNLGKAYMNLSFLKDSEKHVLKAISAFEESLKVTIVAADYPFEEEFPLVYAALLNNLGNAYTSLAKVAQTPKEYNLKATQAFESALKSYNLGLKTRTAERYPLYYAEICNNIGSVYESMSRIKQCKDCVLKAKKYFSESLRVYNMEKDLTVRRKVTNKELKKFQKKIKAESIIKIRGRVLKENIFNNAQALIEEYVKSDIDDIEIKNYLIEIRKPVIYKDDLLGTFNYDRQMKWFTNSILWVNEKIDLQLSIEKMDELDAVIEVAHILYKDQSIWNIKIVDYAINENLVIELCQIKSKMVTKCNIGM